MQLIYNGALDQFTADSAKSCVAKYPYAVEVRLYPYDGENIQDARVEFFKSFDAWLKTASQHTYYTDSGSTGATIMREGPEYCILAINDSMHRMFIFFRVEEDYDSFTLHFLRYVMNCSPFTTVL